jgi:hypothetical protein
MSGLVYKDHVITTETIWDEITEEYASVVRVVWQTDAGRREMHCFTLQNRFATFDKASAVAYEEAKAWADRRLVHLGP